MLKLYLVYSKCIGGVDLRSDQFAVTYRVRVRSKQILQTLETWTQKITYL